MPVVGEEAPCLTMCRFFLSFSGEANEKQCILRLGGYQGLLRPAPTKFRLFLGILASSSSSSFLPFLEKSISVEAFPLTPCRCPIAATLSPLAAPVPSAAAAGVDEGDPASAAAAAAADSTLASSAVSAVVAAAWLLLRLLLTLWFRLRLLLSLSLRLLLMLLMLSQMLFGLLQFWLL